MAINPALLVSAAVLQDYLVDNATGGPLSNGTITLYQDTSRTTFKNWYYQSGSPGNYTYITLPNPMTLSAVGTITDGNGNDTIPFFYPYSETDQTIPQSYYIVVTNSNGQQQFTRQNFPFLPVVETNPTDVTLLNYVTNNVFWRNIGTTTVTNSLNKVICPSNHDGFSMPDIQFFKQATGATDVITFQKFNAGEFLSSSGNLDVTPEYYMNFLCSGIGTETYKYIQIPLSLHLKTLESVPAIISLWARCTSSGGTGGNILTVSIYQYSGTGTSGSIKTPIQTFELPVVGSNANFINLITPAFTMPSSVGIVTGNGADDAIYIQIGYPVGQTFSIDIAKPSFYIGEVLPSNDCQLYDQVDTIINDARTGDVRVSLNEFYPFGWVPMNSGTICNSGSITPPTNLGFARQNVDTWPLFNLIWQKFSAFTSGSTNIIAQMYDNTGAPVAYGASAIADWNASKQISLTYSMGQVILGTVPVSALVPIYTTTFTGSGNTITTSNGMNVFNGMPVYFTGTSTLTPNTIYYVGNISGSTFQVFTSFNNAITQTSPQNVDASGTVIAAFNGSFTGEYAHTQLAGEVGVHTHGTSFPGTATIGPNGNNAVVSNVPGSTHTFINVTANSGGSPFNVTQPGVFYNLFMKL